MMNDCTRYQLAYTDKRGRAVSHGISDRTRLERKMDRLARQGTEFKVFVPGVEGVAGHTFRTDEGELTWACVYGEVEND